MKKIFAILLSVVMLLGTFAIAEPAADYVTLPEGETLKLDLDGDGDEEAVRWEVTVNEYDETPTLYVTLADGTELSQNFGYFFGCSVYVVDLDRDGTVEILIDGDEASDDYVTFCLHFNGTALKPMLFAFTTRGSYSLDDAYTKYGYGRIQSIDGNTITLSGTQDVVGTHSATRVFALYDGMFELWDDGLWIFNVDADDAEVWEYLSLTPVQPIDVTFINEDGTESQGTVATGERILLTASDKFQYTFFVTEGGSKGYFEAWPDYDSYGYIINGIPESDLFEYVPYAD